MRRLAILVAAVALVAAAAQPALAWFPIIMNGITVNAAAVGVGTGAAEGISGIILPSGEMLRR